MRRSLTLSEGAVHLAAERSGYELEPQDGRLIWRRPGLPPLELRAPGDDPRLPRQRLSDAEILAEYLHGDREFAVQHAEVHGVDVMSLVQQARPAAAINTPTA